jgi:hypothetical protein
MPFWVFATGTATVTVIGLGNEIKDSVQERLRRRREGKGDGT